eukprot:3859665-Alexandrium_andersonii.AAC.1
MPSSPGAGASPEQPSERLPGQVLSIETSMQLQGAQAPTIRAVRAAEEERALGGMRHPAWAALRLPNAQAIQDI